ncbi:MAG: alpha/beta fold hydrolase, partial [Actinobacteria bacterium]|nr:alpha/beta fold hydrolase [Actinomycetota bacterium]
MGAKLSNERARAWLEAGAFFEWQPRAGSHAPLQIFHTEVGPEDAPIMALLHGFPTSSIDWCDVVERLAAHYRLCMLDFPGYGFSDKPTDWPYSLFLDVEL